jgi:hypothetical protein
MAAVAAPSIRTAKEISVEDLRAKVVEASAKITDPDGYQSELDVMDHIKFTSEIAQPDGSFSIKLDQKFLDRFYVGRDSVNWRAVSGFMVRADVLDILPNCRFSVPVECYLTYNRAEPKLHNNASISTCTFRVSAGSTDSDVAIALATTCGCDAADQFQVDLNRAIQDASNQEERIESIEFGVNRGEFAIQVESQHSEDRILIATELVQEVLSNLYKSCAGKPREAGKITVDLSEVLSSIVGNVQAGMLDVQWTLQEEPELRFRQKSAQTLRGFSDGFLEVLDLLAAGQAITEGLRKLPHQLDDLSRQDLFAKSNRLWLDHASLGRKQTIQAVADLIDVWEVAVVEARERAYSRL